jgi:DNA-binding NarL/FixJ family response regulator
MTVDDLSVQVDVVADTPATLLDPAAGAPAATAEPSAPPAATTPPLRLSLLDDHRLLVDSMSSWITDNAPGFDVVLARSNWADFVCSPSFPGDLVLLDYQLKEGVSIESRVRTCRAAGAKVIVISGLDTRQTRTRSLGAGASAFLSKDLPMPEIISIAEQIMGVAGAAGPGGATSTSSRSGSVSGAGSAGVGVAAGIGSGAAARAATPSPTVLGGPAPAAGALHGGIQVGSPRPDAPGSSTGTSAPGLVAGPRVVPKLSSGETEALALYSSGLSLAEVAAKMDVQYETAKTYIRRVREKYTKVERPAGTRAELIRRAAEDGFLR